MEYTSVNSTQTLEEPEGMNDAMRGAFARMFADSEFRNLLIHLAQRANQGILSSISSDMETAKVYATRYHTYNRMYELGQFYYTRLEKFKKELIEKKKLAGKQR